jgi:cytochrome P450
MTTAVLPPSPKSRIPGATLIAFRRDPLAFLTRVAREHGDMVYWRGGPIEFVFVNHPDLVKEILVTRQQKFIKSRGLQRAKRFVGEGLLTIEGDAHRRQRRLVQPAFHKERVASYGAAMVEYAERTRERWRDGERLDVSHEMMRLTLSIVGRTLFGAEVEGDADEIDEAFTLIMHQFNRMLMPFSEYLDRLPLPMNRKLERAAARLDATIFRMIAERRASGEDRGDLLSMLLHARDEEGDGAGMNDTQLRDEAMTLFLAGHETTANALTWAWYLLSQNPEVEARLHAEIDEVLGGRLPAVADLPRLRYTEAVFAEAMRLYPPAWAIGRQALEAFPLGDFVVPAKAMVLMSQWVMHRDARFWPEPERFEPERWTPEAKASRPKFAYFPFGGGARVCIGEPFAWMEGVLLLATIAARWRLRLAPDARVAPQALITLRPRYGMPMHAHARSHAHGAGSGSEQGS